MNDYAIGLDIGIASVGWAVLSLDQHGEPNGIISLGSRIFEAAEVAKTGASLAADRRNARGIRRVIRRRRHRKERIKGFIVRSGLLTKKEMDELYAAPHGDIYTLRVEALDRLINNEEFARLLLHLAQRRGFRSNRKTLKPEGESDDGKMLKAVGANAALMREKNYRTVGEMYLRDEAYSDRKHNKGGAYISTVGRDMLLSEIKAIFDAQRAFGNVFASEENEKAYIDIWGSQRNFDEGPGGPSPYAGHQIEKMVGHCSFYPEELRAPKACWSFMYSSLLQYVNSIRIKTHRTDRQLTPEQRRCVIDLVFEKKEVTFADIRKAFERDAFTAIEADETFNTVNYNIHIEEKKKKETKASPSDEKAKEASGAENAKAAEVPPAMTYEQRRDYMEGRVKLKHLAVYHEFVKVLGDMYTSLDDVEKDALGYAFTMFKSENLIADSLRASGIPTEIAEKALSSFTGFSGFGRISLRACRELIPFLEHGMVYSDACAAAGLTGDDDGVRTTYLYPVPEDFTDITSPVARRSISQTIKVINAIIRKRGKSPSYINVELAREMSKSRKERDEIDAQNKKNYERNEAHKKELEEHFKGHKITGQDMLMSWLYEEQNCHSAYSPNGPKIDYDRLFEPGYVEIDHIVPYSRSFDDSMNNKVLVFAHENRDKGNRLPLEYLSGQERDDFVVYTNASVRNLRKRQNLLKEEFTQEDTMGFRDRNLNDTRTISRFILNYLQDNLAFAPNEFGRKKTVTAVNGAVTAYIRKQLGISKIRADGDTHHAVDAVIIACVTDGIIHAVSTYATRRENGLMNAPRLPGFPQPWDDFRAELDARLSADPKDALERHGLWARVRFKDEVQPVYVSRMVKHTATGPAHKATLLSERSLGGGKVYVHKVPLTELNEAKLENIYNSTSDTLLYNAIKKRLKEYNGDGKRAFKEPFYKPKSDGTEGPIVRSIKLMENKNNCVAVPNSHAFAENSSMVRIDVYYVDKKGYYFVPVYVTDMVAGAAPRKACIPKKTKDKWKDMDKKDFVFSLSKNDLILLKLKHNDTINLSIDKKKQSSEIKDTDMVINGEKPVYLYYKYADTNTAKIEGITVNGKFKWGRGILGIERIEKCSIDVLGNITVLSSK